MSEIILTKENFDSEISKSDSPILVDFWAVWCGPCKMLAPVISEIATEYEGRVRVGKVNVDEQQELAARYRIESIPTVMLFSEGQVVDSSIGFVPKQVFTDMLSKY